MKKASKISEYKRLSAIIEANKSHYDNDLIDLKEYYTNFITVIEYIDWLLSKIILFYNRYDDIEISVPALREIISSLNDHLNKINHESDKKYLKRRKY
ncbi:hypothetical protein [Chryseobacterium turcicum]|uniref:Uncharacterized protein n=1 Tax=Chryseobacterium turcicum TaxID=2898076 RepID=A0A9Q3V0P5_9FLAO|nr:hypothetical protein [Chryseobacterium turcicum]MCD1115598.1 hypothetical protein [Chryseobacterium turcicum]